MTAKQSGEFILQPMSDGVKNPWAKEERQYVLKHHADMYIEDIAEHLNRPVPATKQQAFVIGCGYYSRKGDKR